MANENSLAHTVHNKFLVAVGHFLVFPKHHTDEYFSLTQNELIACDSLLRQLRGDIKSQNPSAKGSNLGMNAEAISGKPCSAARSS